MAVATAIVVAALAVVSARETAPVAREIPIQLTGCADELGTTLPALVSLEIDVLRRERGETRAAPEAIAVRCAGDTAVIEVTVAGARRSSNVALGALAPDHRGRALALAAAELFDALGAIGAVGGRGAAEPAPSAAPASAIPSPSASLQVTRSDDSATLAVATPSTVLVGATAEWLGRPAALLFGARIAYQQPLSRLLCPMVSLDGALGDVSSAPGRVAVRTLGLGAHLLFLLSARSVRFEGGPGIRVGWAHLAGQPAAASTLEGDALSAWWGGPELRVRASIASHRGPRAALELSGGIVALPVQGLVDGSTPAYALEGRWFSISLQLGLDLGSGQVAPR